MCVCWARGALRVQEHVYVFDCSTSDVGRRTSDLFRDARNRDAGMLSLVEPVVDDAGTGRVAEVVGPDVAALLAGCALEMLVVHCAFVFVVALGRVVSYHRVGGRVAWERDRLS